jgi:hypothetical protein
LTVRRSFFHWVRRAKGSPSSQVYVIKSLPVEEVRRPACKEQWRPNRIALTT